MKRYEKPMVELTKFDVEDVITLSVDTVTMTPAEENEARQILANENYNAIDVYNW